MTVCKKQRDSYWDKLWTVCWLILRAVIPNNADCGTYNALSVSHNFGSLLHLDSCNITFQHVVAIGDFGNNNGGNGELCTEFDDSGSIEVRLDVQDRLGQIDGRFVHWVSE